MIKSIQSNEIFNTPFSSNKSWTLSASSSVQTVEEGFFVSSSYNFFDSASAAQYGFVVDTQNSNGTYKRLVYQLIKNAYYNPNIAQSFGLETTDTDKVVKILQNSCVRITLPRIYFGESILRDSVVLVDRSKDKDYIIYDDTYGNLYVDGTHFIDYTETTSSLYSAPTVDFTASPLSGFAPLATTVSPIVSGNVTEYLWDLGDGTTSISSSAFSHVYTNPGTYTISLTASGFGGTKTKTRTNYITANAVIPLPTVSFTGTPLSGYIPLTVSFTNSTTGASSYLWSFGDLSGSASENPSHVYTSAGIYDVTLVATNAGGSTTLTIPSYITALVVPVPVADFELSPLTGVYASITTINFTNKTTGVGPITYLWNFGDTNTSTSENPTHIYSTPGTYTITLTATNVGGSDSEIKTNIITVSSGIVPVASFTLTPSVGDIPLSVAFTNTTSENAVFNPYSWAWNFGDTNTSTSKNPSPNTYSTKGTYTVSLTATNVAGSSTPATTTVTAYDPADRLDYSPSTQLMNWGDGTRGLPGVTFYDNITLASFKSIIDPTNIKTIEVTSATNPITTISNTNYYTALKTLDLSNQNLSSISGIGISGLLRLTLDNNSSLSSINVSDLTSLSTLAASDCNLSGTFNINGKPTLTNLWLNSSNGALTTINVTGNTGLNWLSAYDNSGLTSITGLSDCTNMYMLIMFNCDLRGTGLTPFNISALTELRFLQVSGNPNMASLDVTNNTKLTALYCQDNGLSSINTSNNTELQYLAVNGNSLTSLNVTNNTKLIFLYMYANTSVGIPTGFSGLTKLKDLAMAQCGITVPINCTPFVDLETFSCGDSDTNIPSVNLSTCTKLKSVIITKCSLITTFNLPASVPQLKTVYGYQCALTAAEVNSILTKLDANGISGGQVELYGGTNAAPTGAGITAKNNLLSKGWTVTTN